MGFIKDIVGKASGLLNKIAPIAMFIPGLQWVGVATMALNVAKGLMQKPPDWKGILTSVVSQAIPMGMGKALQAFTKGGTALQFSKIFGEKMSETLGQVATKVGNKSFTGAIAKLQTHFTSPTFTNAFAKVVNTATGTSADQHLTAQMIRSAAPRIQQGTMMIMNPVINTVAAPLEHAQSAFDSATRRPANLLPENYVPASPVIPDADTSWRRGGIIPG
ncbi:MAG: hypothetical protein JNK82_12825 [Myxococcaceae bacterium]|nr:hypothetical protein [Myxococcaceae bacterium]